MLVPRSAVVFFAAVGLALVPLIASAQGPPSKKQVPPAGIAIPDEDRKTLSAGAKDLRKKLDRLASELRLKPDLLPLLPDVEIFHKAVHWAVEYGEIFDPKQIVAAQKLLAEGHARADALQAGRADWLTKPGLVVRGYRSRIDHSVQPYGLVIPASWKPGDTRPRRLDLWQHGRNDKLSELAFIDERMHKPGEFTPPDTFVLHPYGRFCNATKFAGETDVFEALAHVRKHYAIDPKRLTMRGFSMGGASAWHLGAHHAWMWAAVAPGAGFAETAEYTKALAPGKVPPPEWEQVLWRLYDATLYSANLANTSVVAYSGEEDKQIQAAEIMSRFMAEEGLELPHLLGPKTGHKYEPKAKEELSKLIDAAAAKGREAAPAEVRRVTYTLRYPRQEWVRVDAMEKHWERAEIAAQLVDEGTIKATTRNVTAFSLVFDDEAVPLDPTNPPRISIDDQELVGPVVAKPYTAHFTKAKGRWITAKTPGEGLPELRKRTGLQGPIDDAFMDSFVFVRPTGKALNAALDGWVQGEMKRAIPQWRRIFRGDARVVDDREVTPELAKDANLVLWGDPSSNAVLAKVLPQLPLRWTAEGLEFAGKKYNAEHHAPVLIFPNPLNPKRYVVINSSFTFREGSDVSNALQTPKLPDWAIIDLQTPPTDRAPGAVVQAGFFDEAWQLSPAL